MQEAGWLQCSRQLLGLGPGLFRLHCHPGLPESSLPGSQRETQQAKMKRPR